ncbi:metal ABC transporter permease [Bacillus suaedaesalsae]|uniref:Metal ABC transporter permease n=1 Tax=Bacillus suaedaesalsae TaxID=2810349 RepID=A0ABS2DHU5_9BACI|nr:metal ABC transporter permease [Bacillus suaedaesalsae]MBM6618062.1 metal ABC transporter permease [Bacillus suaedaesalsae]
MLDTLISLLQDSNTQWVLLGTMLLGLASGVLGSFALLKKQSLIGDAMAHAALPGICLAFLITGEKSILAFMIGAVVLGYLASFLITSITKHSRIKEDTAIGLVLSVFFGIGIVLLTYIAGLNNGNQTGLDDFIFGQAASLIGTDVTMMMIISGVLLVTTFLLFKELKLITFDAQFAQGIGLPVSLLNGLLMLLIVSAVVIGLQAVGVVLMSAMLITPAISARYWTDRLDFMVIISGSIGAISGMVGTLLSTVANGMPTGPLIIVAATFIFLVSLVFSPKRGLVTKAMRYYKLRKITERQQVLQEIYQKIEGIDHDSMVQLSTIGGKGRAINALIKQGLLQNVGDDSIKLTSKGLHAAYEIVLNNRLMEVYLMNEMRFAHLQIPEDRTLSFLDIPKREQSELLNLLYSYGRSPKLVPVQNGYHNGGVTHEL